jgi:hypothetical protein
MSLSRIMQLAMSSSIRVRSPTTSGDRGPALVPEPRLPSQYRLAEKDSAFIEIQPPLGESEHRIGLVLRVEDLERFTGSLQC